MDLYLNIFLLILLLAGGAWLFMLSRRVTELTRQHESLIQELTRQVEANRNLSARLSVLESKVNQLKQPAPALEKPKPKKVKPVPAAKPELQIPREKSEGQENLWHDVVFLAKQGLAAETIARDLNITRGEVELILGLHNFKPKEN